MPALLVSVGIFGLSNVASATVDADLDGVDDAVEAANARSVHATINSTNVLFDSRRGSDRLLFDINLGVEGFSVRFGHFETGDIPTQDDFTSFSMFRLIEYNNLDGNFVYNPGVDQSIAEYIPSAWRFVSYTDDSVARGFHAVELQTGDGIVSVTARLGSTFGVSGNMLITPASLKFDVEINGFSFTNSSTALAAWFKVVRNGSATLENPTATESLFSRAGETGIRFGPTGAPRASIAWADQVIADSTPVNVHPGALSQSIGPTGTTEHGIYITLAQGGKLQWDPRVGIDGILQPDIPPAPPAPIPWETIGLVAAGIAGGVIAGIVIGRAKSGYATRRRVEVLKSNRQGNTRPDEQDASTSKAQDHDSSRSNKTASQVDVDTGNNGESEARGHNSTRSNRTTTKSAPALDGGGSDGGGGGSKVQDHNSSRSNKSSSIATPDADGGNSSDQGKERGITINTSHVEYETKASSDLDYHRPPSLRGDAAQAVNQELHRPPTNRMHDKTSAKLEEPRTTTNKIEALTIKQGVVADAATKVLQGSALSLAEADGLDQLAQKLRYGNPLSDEEIDAIGQILSHNSKAPVDARKVLSRRNSKTMLREGLDKVVKLIERATSGLKDTLKTQV